MTDRDKEIVNGLCNEVSYMGYDDSVRLRNQWRWRYGHESALPSIYELAIELALERKLINID